MDIWCVKYEEPPAASQFLSFFLVLSHEYPRMPWNLAKVLGTRNQSFFVSKVASHGRRRTRRARMESVFIPCQARGLAISTFPISVRLRHIFAYQQLRLLGDLHGISYVEFAKFRNCGKKTVWALQELVRMVQ